MKVGRAITEACRAQRRSELTRLQYLLLKREDRQMFLDFHDWLIHGTPFVKNQPPLEVSGYNFPYVCDPQFKRCCG